MQFASAENNTIIMYSAHVVFMVISVFALNLLLLFTYRKSFKFLLSCIIIISALCSYFIDSFGTIIDKDMINNMMKTDTAEVLDLFTIKLALYFFFLALIPIDL